MVKPKLYCNKVAALSPRQQQGRLWLRRLLGNQLRVCALPYDASVRRYCRVFQGTQRYIFMDAPPDGGDNGAFVRIALLLKRHGIHVPSVLAMDLRCGFLLVEDLGSRHYLDALQKQDADRLYHQAIEVLLSLQGISSKGLPLYNRQMLWDEMELFHEWFIGRHLRVQLKPSDIVILHRAMDLICNRAEQERQLFVHRDYHSKNLMQTEKGQTGILDFQGAVKGPQSYDLVSLLQDCYIGWPPEKRQHWLRYYVEKGQEIGLSIACFESFLEDFYHMGIQRHLKALGQFARLQQRDNRPDYLDQAAPRTWQYLLHATARIPTLKALHHLLLRLENLR